MKGQEELNLLASELRIALDCPEGWVEVFEEEFIGPHVGIAVDVTLEEVGDAESGPKMSMEVHKYIEVRQLLGRLVVDLHDNTQCDFEYYNPPEWHEKTLVASFEVQSKPTPTMSRAYADAKALKAIFTFLGLQFKAPV